MSASYSAPISASISALPILHQILCQLPSSTWDIPSTMDTAGPQPGTFRAQ